MKNEQTDNWEQSKVQRTKRSTFGDLANQKLVNVHDKEHAEQLNFHRMISLNFLFLVIYAGKYKDKFQ